MTTMALEQRPLIQEQKHRSNWWRTLPGRLLALLRRLFERMSAMAPDLDHAEQIREQHRVKYMYLIHKM